MMNFAVAVDDHELKLTHIIRGKDHEDQTRRQQNIFKFMALKEKIRSFEFFSEVAEKIVKQCIEI